MMPALERDDFSTTRKLKRSGWHLRIRTPSPVEDPLPKRIKLEPVAVKQESPVAIKKEEKPERSAKDEKMDTAEDDTYNEHEDCYKCRKKRCLRATDEGQACTHCGTVQLTAVFRHGFEGLRTDDGRQMKPAGFVDQEEEDKRRAREVCCSCCSPL